MPNEKTIDEVMAELSGGQSATSTNPAPTTTDPEQIEQSNQGPSLFEQVRAKEGEQNVQPQSDIPRPDGPPVAIGEDTNPEPGTDNADAIVDKAIVKADPSAAPEGSDDPQPGGEDATATGDDQTNSGDQGEPGTPGQDGEGDPGSGESEFGAEGTSAPEDDPIDFEENGDQDGSKNSSQESPEQSSQEDSLAPDQGGQVSSQSSEQDQPGEQSAEQAGSEEGESTDDSTVEGENTESLGEMDDVELGGGVDPETVKQAVEASNPEGEDSNGTPDEPEFENTDTTPEGEAVDDPDFDKFETPEQVTDANPDQVEPDDDVDQDRVMIEGAAKISDKMLEMAHILAEHFPAGSEDKAPDPSTMSQESLDVARMARFSVEALVNETEQLLGRSIDPSTQDPLAEASLQSFVKLISQTRDRANKAMFAQGQVHSILSRATTIVSNHPDNQTVAQTRNKEITNALKIDGIVTPMKLLRVGNLTSLLDDFTTWISTTVQTCIKALGEGQEFQLRPFVTEQFDEVPKAYLTYPQQSRGIRLKTATITFPGDFVFGTYENEDGQSSMGLVRVKAPDESEVVSVTLPSQDECKYLMRNLEGLSSLLVKYHGSATALTSAYEYMADQVEQTASDDVRSLFTSEQMDVILQAMAMFHSFGRYLVSFATAHCAYVLMDRDNADLADVDE